MALKVLNLYSGIGGNRKLWEDVDVTAVEYDAKIAKIYQDFYPNDKVVVGDAHEFLRKNYNDYDFIWASPPCPTHSKLSISNIKKEVQFPDMKLYEEILLLQHFFKGKWVVENVIAYYEPLIKPTATIHRHFIWANFKLRNKEFENLKTCVMPNERDFLSEKLGFNLDKYTGVDKRKLLRNCVVPEMGLHIMDCARNIIRKSDTPQLSFLH